MKILLLHFAITLLATACTRKIENSLGTQDLSALLEVSKTSDERVLNLKEVSAKIVLVNFWASWCGPCMEETPALLKFVSENDKNVVLISVNEDESQKNMQKFANLFPLFKSKNVYLIYDLDRKWSQSFAVYKFPETFIFDLKPKLLKKFEGSVPFQDPNIKTLILGLYQAN